MPEPAERAMWTFVERAFGICRSITGDGVRQTLSLLAERLPLEVHEVPTGTTVLDWTVPREWSIRDAWVKDPSGTVVIDFADHNLHLVGYSSPIHRKLDLADLKPHLHSLPDRPEWIPYRTSYYTETWGFCLPHRQLESLPDGEYEVFIDSSLEDGALSYGELLLPGDLEDEVLFSCHICHPSMANDNLSGVAVCMALAEHLARSDRRRLSYRFLFVPGTIGAITWLARNEETTRRVRHGLVAANLGDGDFHYKRSRHGDAAIDRAVIGVLAATGRAHTTEDFMPFGYDERQYSSPGFDLAIGSLTRTPWGRYPEYHTSADNLDFISAGALQESLDLYLEVVEALEHGGAETDPKPQQQPAPRGATYLNLSPKGEPQLGRRGLYRSLGGGDAGRQAELALLWVLNLSDGRHGLIDIAERSSLPLDLLENAARELLEVDLLEKRSPCSPVRISGREGSS